MAFFQKNKDELTNSNYGDVNKHEFVTGNIDTAVYLAIRGTIEMQKDDVLNGLQNQYSFRSITAGFIMGLYAFAVENQIGKNRINEFFSSVKKIYGQMSLKENDYLDPEWLLELALYSYNWLSKKASKHTINSLSTKLLIEYARMYMKELLDGGRCFDRTLVTAAINNINDYHSIVCKQFDMLIIK